MTKMNPEVKRLWIEDLESGEIPQGLGLLHDQEGKMCCLGVLCYIGNKLGFVPDPILHSDYLEGSSYYRYGVFESGFDLPGEIMNWAKLAEEDPTIVFTDEEIYDFFGDEVAEMMVGHEDEEDYVVDLDPWRNNTLAGLNDEHRPFSLIARIIDRKL